MKFIWNDNVSSVTYQDALHIRKQVFIAEQNVEPHLEIDDLEDKCHNVVGYIDDVPVATARLYFNGKYAKVQRVAVMEKFRGMHFGKQLMQEVERFAKKQHYERLVLGAQNHAILFYQKLGFSICSQEYSEANILHHDMEKWIKEGNDL
ncbi:GNAT family N-acetyltransferase [Carnobacteriaceae bacterium zg-C25]|nr:GNAT family N-acetyltransferase [Carnobacteriaceae bacterium zg-C25]